MNSKPPRWRWGRSTADGESPRLFTSALQSQLQGLAARLGGDASAGQAYNIEAARSFVVRPTADHGTLEQTVAGVSTWHGGQSPATRMTIRMMEVGDEVLLLNADRRRAIVRVARVVRAAYPAPTTNEGNRLAVDLGAVSPLSRPIMLSQLRADPRLNDLSLHRVPTPELVRLSAEQRTILRRLGVG